jgi:cell division protein FtsX
MDEPKDDFLAEDDFPDWPGEPVPDDELTEEDLEAIADIEAGRFISHEAMVRWLESWGTENELPPPECGM